MIVSFVATCIELMLGANIVLSRNLWKDVVAFIDVESAWMPSGIRFRAL